ncbi:hypothetical protein HHL19_21755 [Streptomyces sp. R302]|uniref:hypothetical protein n=1 Tax=unclassified Streptomyces TaxID=2593676 RepID=UPI00145F0DB0|nr:MULTISPECIES: hypothetical protein [unclassified Streptomyces]NML51600.1 hypothetical protein [Streptomyces sp. R301]NML81220.1 hypothetical protein [Streptomyces sp. R302]
MDALLLEVPAQHWPSRLSDSPVRYGRLVTSLPGTTATAIGFAAAGRTAGEIETTQVSGVVHPGDGMLGDRWRLSAHGPVPDGPGASGWQGMSGAALWAHGVLCGVITEDAANWAHGKLDAVPAHRLLRDPEFQEVLRERTGRTAVVEPVELLHLSESPAPHRLPRSPAELLRPQVEAMPFIGRTALLDELREWCGGEGVSVRLVVGPGGQGKTRLAREFARRLAAEGWAACQFRESGPASVGDGHGQGLAALAAVDRPLLIVMDYADTRPSLITDVLRVLEERPVDAPVRLLLIARSSGEWWQHLPGNGPRSAGILGGARVVRLRDAAEGASERQRFYRAAVTSLAVRLARLPGHTETDWEAAGRSLAPGPEHFAGASSGSALVLQMRALTDLLNAGKGQGPRISGTSDSEVDVESLLLDHEEGYWRRTAAQYPALADLEAGVLAEAVALATLTRVRNGDRAVQLLATAPALAGLSEKVLTALTRWLRDLYPDINDSYWGALAPDRLSEYHVARRVHGGSGLLTSLLPQLEESEAEHPLTVLARAAALPVRLDPDLAGKIDDLVRTFPRRLVVPAVTVAVRSENPGVLVNPVSTVVQRADLPVELAERLLSAVPQRSRLLGDEAVRLAVRLRAVRRNRVLWRAGGRIGPVRERAGWAAAEHELALRLGAIHRWEESLAASSRAVGIYRVLAHGSPEEFQKDLVDALSFRSMALSELALDQDALAAATEAVTMGERLVEEGGDEEGHHRLRLAVALSNRSVPLAAKGELAAALTSCEQALDLLTGLARDRPSGYDEVLGGVLHNLANRYAAVFTAVEDAARVSGLAVQVRRRLALAVPDAHLRDLLDSLHNHAADLTAAGEHVRALEVLEECVALSLELAEERHSVQLAQLARALLAQASVLDELERYTEALLCSARAVLFYRALADRLPDRYEPHLMKALGVNAVLALLAGTDAARYDALIDERDRLRRRISEREHERQMHRTRWQRRRDRTVLGLLWAGRLLASLPRIRVAIDVHRPGPRVRSIARLRLRCYLTGPNPPALLRPDRPNPVPPQVQPDDAGDFPREDPVQEGAGPASPEGPS